MSLSLVIMAAGLGARFGGNKPLAEVGPQGQALFEYSVHDAFKAGFTHVVFVVGVQQDIAEFSARLQNYGDKLKVEFVVQTLAANGEPDKTELSVGRTKPWGTAHAVLACRNHIQNPFVVINADDFYGRENYEKIGDYLLANAKNVKACVLPGYRLENTLSRTGGVNRGICAVSSDGYLESIREVKNIVYSSSNSLQYDQSDDAETVQHDSVVSMTFWGFVPAIFNLLDVGFQAFLNETPNLDQDEFYLPAMVNQGIESGLLQVKVFDTLVTWKGLTYAEDLADVKDFIFKVSESGWYAQVGRS